MNAVNEASPNKHIKNESADDTSRQVKPIVSLQNGGRVKFENFRDMVLQKEKEGKVVVATFDGFAEIDIDEIVKQSAESILYDLNRDKATVLTYIEDKKWVNDYACGVVIRKLKALLPKKQLV